MAAESGAGGEFEDLMEGVGEEVVVFAAELADQVVVGGRIGAAASFKDRISKSDKLLDQR